ncbi:threonine/serine exporter family protein [Brevibacterium daeguense]|uniref:threonine/serine exporter family protein n=1 Tax=Brevibacterium daeguense TaxID=909936 RepID=UPI0031D73899
MTSHRTPTSPQAPPADDGRTRGEDGGGDQPPSPTAGAALRTRTPHSAPTASDPGAGARATPDAGLRSAPDAGSRPTPDAGPQSAPDAGSRSDSGAGSQSAPDAAAPTAAPTDGAGTSRAKRLLGKTRPAGANPKNVAERIARKAVNRIISDKAPTTQPIPIVQVLKGTPYQKPVEASAKSEDAARMILDLAVDIGAIMLRAGANTADVEASVIATCTSLGLPNSEVDLTSNSLTVHYTDPEGRHMTALRVNREESIHFAKLSSVHKLVTDMVDGRTEYLEARERLDAIRRQRRPYTEPLVTLAWGFLAACFVILLGGSYLSAALGLVMAIINDRLGKLLARTGMPEFFNTLIQAAFTTLVAMTAWTLDLIASPQFLVASGIVLLLPTMGIIAAVQDALTDFPITASGRLVRVLMTMAGIVSGIALGLMIGEAIGLSPVEIIVDSGGVEVLATIISTVAAFGVGAAACVGNLTSRRVILPAAIIGLVGFIVYVVGSVLGLGNIINCLISSTVVGLLCRPIALRRGAPPIVVLVPAIFPLLQGLSIFSAVYEIVQPQEAVPLSLGLSSLLAAITANATLAVGATFGDFLARPLRSRKKTPVDTPPPE